MNDWPRRHRDTENILSMTGRKALLVVSLIVAAASAPLSAASEEQEYNAAWRQYQSGNTAAAIKGFSSYLAKHPRGKFLPEAHFTIARIEPSGNNAFVHYQFIIDNYPGHELASQASYATAQYYLSLGALPEAAARLIATYSRYPATAGGSESLYRLTLLAIAADSLDNAGRYAQAFAANYPENARGAQLLTAIADHWQSRDDTARANPGWREIIERYPRSDEAGTAREQLLANAGEREDDDAEAPGNAVPEPAAARTPPAHRRNGLPKGYYVQVGAYTNPAVLRDWKGRLESKAYRCVVDSAVGAGRKTYRLLAGPYADRKQAQAAASAIKARERINVIVVQK